MRHLFVAAVALLFVLAAGGLSEDDPDVVTADDMDISGKDLAYRAWDAFTSQLQNGTHQWVNALVSLVLGILMVLSGNGTYHWLVVGYAFAFTYLLTLVVCTGTLFVENDILLKVESFVCGLIGAFATHRGIDGIEVVMGAVVGGCIAIAVHCLWNRHINVAWAPFLLIVVDNALIVAACVLLVVFRKKVVEIVLPFCGVPFIVSSLMFGITGNSNLIHGPSSHIVTGAWVDYLLLLFSFGGKSHHIGMFVGKDVGPVSLDWLIGWIVILILEVFVALKVYFVTLRKKKQELDIETAFPGFKGKGV